MSQEADEQLAARYAQTGEAGAFEELVRRHASLVRAVIHPMVLDHADADDLTQEVFLRLARSAERFRGESRFTTWLYRIAANAAVDFLRRKARCPVAATGALPEEPAGVPDPEQAAHARETEDAVAGALAGLSPKLRAAITLTAINGLNVAEAARIEDCLTATMYWRVHQARKILRRRLEGR